MKFRKYVFRRYSSSFPLLFRREKARLRKLLSKSARIVHVGSTAVPGLGGKGIIDVYVSVRKRLLEKNKRRLESAGFVFKPWGEAVRDCFFERITNILAV